MTVLQSAKTCRTCQGLILRSENGDWYHTKRTPPHPADPGCPSGECGHAETMHTVDHGCWEDDCMCEAKPRP